MPTTKCHYRLGKTEMLSGTSIGQQSAKYR